MCLGGKGILAVNKDSYGKSDISVEILIDETSCRIYSLVIISGHSSW